MAAQDIEEDSDAPRIVQPLENSKLLGERAGAHPHRRTDLPVRVEVKDAVVTRQSHHRFDDALRCRAGEISSHNEAGHSKGAVDASPALAVHIEGNEEIAREERGNDSAKLSCMPNRLLTLWQKGPEQLVGQLRVRSLLGEWQGMDRIPSFPFLESISSLRSEFARTINAWTRHHRPDPKMLPS